MINGTRCVLFKKIQDTNADCIKLESNDLCYKGIKWQDLLIYL